MPICSMTARSALFVLTAALVLAGCVRSKPPQRSLVGDFPAPGIYALAGDTITIWKRVPQPNGTALFYSYSITPGGTVEYLAAREQTDIPDISEDGADFSEHRKGFALPHSAFEAVRAKAARLRPGSLGPVNPVGGYGGEVVPAGCALDPVQPRIAGINFLNRANWGTFTLQSGCQGANANAASALVGEIFDRLGRAGGPAQK
jgi:hypothetical protein